MAIPFLQKLLRLSLHDCVEQFYRSFYFRPSKIWEIVSEMAKSWGMTRRRPREGVEFFHFLRAHRASHSG